MTEEEFKKVMSKVICFIVIALIILIIIGILVFYNSGNSNSIFESKEEKDAFYKKVNEVNSYNITKEEAEKLEDSSEFSEQEDSQSEVIDGEEQVPEENSQKEE